MMKNKKPRTCDTFKLSEISRSHIYIFLGGMMNQVENRLVFVHTEAKTGNIFRNSSPFEWVSYPFKTGTLQENSFPFPF